MFLLTLTRVLERDVLEVPSWLGYRLLVAKHVCQRLRVTSIRELHTATLVQKYVGLAVSRKCVGTLNLYLYNKEGSCWFADQS